MPLKEWKKISSKVKFKNPYWTYLYDECELPNGKIHEYHSVYTNGSAMTIPITDDGKIILVSQYRYLNQRVSIEFPCGSIKDNEDADFTARKELIEETGFDGKIFKIGFFNPYNGITNEICHVYTATELKSSDTHQKDESEEFEYFFLTEQQIDEKIASNEIYDGMTLAAWSLYKLKKKHL